MGPSRFVLQSSGASFSQKAGSFTLWGMACSTAAWSPCVSSPPEPMHHTAQPRQLWVPSRSRRAVTDLLHCMHVYFCLGFTCALFSQYNLRIFFLYLTRITIQIFSRDFQRGVSATIRSNLFVISWKNSLDSIGANSREKNVSK